MQVDVEMYLAASPPLFSPLMGPLDVVSGRSTSSSSSIASHRPYYASPRSAFHDRTFSASHTLDFDFSSMTLSPALLRTAAETTGLLGRRRASPPTCSQQAASNSHRQFHPQRGSNHSASTMLAPLRSCLVIRPEEDNNDSSSSSSEPSSPLSEDAPVSPGPNGSGNKKKRVVFADAKGLSLTQVKMMTEPSDCPPRWTAEFLEQVRKKTATVVLN